MCSNGKRGSGTETLCMRAEQQKIDGERTATIGYSHAFMYVYLIPLQTLYIYPICIILFFVVTYSTISLFYQYYILLSRYTL